VELQLKLADIKKYRIEILDKMRKWLGSEDDFIQSITADVVSLKADLNNILTRLEEYQNSKLHQ
jgi:hypothetical protein